MTVTTPFPAIVAEPGSTASFKLAIDVSSARQVSLKAEDVPSGWTARFRGGGLVIDGAYVTPGDTPDVTLDVEIPDGTAAGSTNLRVVATGGGGVDTLPLTIRVADAAAGAVTLTSDFPELQAAAGSTFTFNVTLHNDTAADTTYTMQATGPDGWTVGAKPQSQAQATTLTVNAGATGEHHGHRGSERRRRGRLLPDHAHDERRRQGRDPRPRGHDHRHLHAHAQHARPGPVDDGECRLREGVRAEPREQRVRSGHGRHLQLQHPDRLEGRVHARPMPPSVDPGTPVPVTATITPSADAIAGDYELTMTAKGTEASDDVTIRVRVETPAAVVDRRGRAHRPRVRGPVLGLPDVRAAVGP